MSALVEMVGRQFGRLTVTRRAANDARDQARWECLCECGQPTVVSATHLRRGRTTSCGCFRREYSTIANTTHGQAGKRHGVSPEYVAWRLMIQRCEDPKCPSWERYGARGISACPRWRQDFTAFLADVGAKPSPKHTLEREDNNGNYDPRNVRWATRVEQARNRRTTRWVTYGGMSMSFAEACERAGVSYGTAYSRLQRGVAAEDALRPTRAAVTAILLLFLLLPSMASAYTVYVLGDSGTGSSAQTRVRDRMLATGMPDALIHTGDMAYSDGTASQVESYFFTPYKPFFDAGKKFWPCLGNHDARSKAVWLNAHNPSVHPLSPAPGGKTYYSADILPDVHLLMVDSNIGSDATQKAWARSDLAASNATWKIGCCPKWWHLGHPNSALRTLPESRP